MAANNKIQTGLMGTYDANDTYFSADGKTAYGYGATTLFTFTYDNDQRVGLYLPLIFLLIFVCKNSILGISSKNTFICLNCFDRLILKRKVKVFSFK